jgi:hypothetical protein
MTHTLGNPLDTKKKKKSFVIYFVSKIIAPTKLNYIVIENKFLKVIYVINIFWNYINIYPMFVHINNHTIHYLMNKPITNVLALEVVPRLL